MSETPVIIPAEQNIPTAEVQKQTSYMPLVIFFFLIIILLGGIFAYFLFSKNAPLNQIGINSVSPTSTVPSHNSVSGTVYFEGYAPTGSYLAIAEKGSGETSFKDVVSGISPNVDGMTDWVWKDALTGQNYQIRVTLKQSGKVIEASETQTISAPATDVALVLVSQLQPPQPKIATMSGQINLDGYAPSGSTLQVLAKTVTASTFQTIVTNIAAVDNANWTWTNAEEGTTYNVKAQLVNANGSVISTGDTQTVTAPSDGELLNVYSTALPIVPSPTAVGISGTITVNGSIPSGSYITLATRPAGTTNFNQVANNIAATSGVNFSWANATVGQQYDVQAYLWANGKPYASSNIITVTAPSTFDILTINAQIALQQPSTNTFNISCGSSQNNMRQVTINYNTQANLPSPKSYTVVVTSPSQNTQIVNTTVTPSNPTSSQSLTTTFLFQLGATYYAQYAYSQDGSTFSPLSPSLQFACQ